MSLLSTYFWPYRVFTCARDLVQQPAMLHVASYVCYDADRSPGLCALASATVVTPLLYASVVSHGVGEFQMR